MFTLITYEQVLHLGDIAKGHATSFPPLAVSPLASALFRCRLRAGQCLPQYQHCTAITNVKWMKTLALVISVNTGYMVNMKCKLLCTAPASAGIWAPWSVTRKFCATRGSGICQPRGFLRAFHKHRVTDSKSKHQTTYGEIYRKRQADQLVCQGLEKLVEVLILCFLDFMAIFFFHCSSSQKCYSDMNQSSDEWLRIWIKFSKDNIQKSWHYNRLFNENFFLPTRQSKQDKQQ